MAREGRVTGGDPGVEGGSPQDSFLFAGFFRSGRMGESQLFGEDRDGALWHGEYIWDLFRRCAP